MRFFPTKLTLPVVTYAFLALISFRSLIRFYFFKYTFYSPGYISFFLLFATGSLGTYYYTPKSSMNINILNMFCILKFLTNFYILPIIIAEIYRKYEFSNELILAHLILPLLSLIPYEKKHKIEDITVLDFKTETYYARVRESMDFVIFCNIVSLVMVSILEGNTMGVLAGFIYMFNHFVITERGYVEKLKMPTEPFFVFGMGLFCFLANEALVS